MKINYKTTALFLFGFLWSFPIMAQKENFRNYTIKDGLVESIVYHINQSSKGYLLISTDGGLSIFDGINFKNFNTANGLPSPYVNYTIEDSKENLLIGTYDGLAVFDGVNFTQLNSASGLTDNLIWTIEEIDDSTVWLGTAKGITELINYKKNELVMPEAIATSAVWSIKKINKKILVASNKGLWEYNNGRFTPVESDSFRSNLPCFNIFKDRNGVVWVGSSEGLIKIDGQTLSLIDDLPIEKKVIYWITDDPDGSLWLATQKGLLNYSNGVSKFYDKKTGLSDNSALTLFTDRENNIWIGTNYGISLLSDKRFTIKGEEAGIKNSIWSIFRDSKSNFWIGDDTGIKLLTNKKLVDINSLKGFAKGPVWSILEDSKGKIWFGCDDGYIVKDGNKFSEYRKKKSAVYDAIMSLCEDADKNIWMGSYDNGVLVKGDKIDTIFTVTDGLSSNTIYNIFNDSRNTIWLMTGNGITKYSNGRFEKLVLDSLELDKFTFYQGMEDHKGNLWFGSYEMGVVYVEFKNNKVLSYKILNDKNGLNNNSVLFIDTDKNNHLWIGTNKGINILNLNKFYENSAGPFQFSAVSGNIPHTEVNQNSIFCDKNGEVFYGSLNGMINFNPSAIAPATNILGPYITSLKVFLETADLNPYGDYNPDNPLFPDNLVLPPDQNHISFDFVSINHSNPESINYKYILEGFEKTPQIFTNKTSVTYGVLAPGKYTFKVWSSLSFNFDNNNFASYSFTIKAPVWQTLWFNFTIIVLMLATSFGVYKIRVKRVNRRNRELEKVIKERLLYEELLMRSEKDYRGLFENAHDAILIIDPEEYVVIDANNSAGILYGYPLYELKGKHIFHLAKNPETAINNITAVINEAKSINFESVHLSKDKKEIVLEINATEIFYRDKKAVLGIMRDVSQRKLTEKNLEKAKDAAEKSNRLKTEFLAQMSHEIRTPINTMLSFNSLIKEEIEKNVSSDLLESFGMIERAGKRVIRTIDLLLNMSQIQTGTYEASLDNFNLYERILNQLFFDYKFEAQANGLTLNLFKKIDCPIVYADEYTIAQILHNLLDNAIKYTHRGEITITVGKDPQDNVFVSVADTGIGIDEKYLPNLFAPFTQEEQGYSRQYEGNGLGLALVKSYCDINDVNISVESQKGEGTIFKLTFKS